MKNNITIPYNDVFFYGLSMKSRDVSDVSGDIFSNILMRYLTSLKPVTNRLYRVADNAKYEYSYSFVPSKTISWRVIKNRRVIEDVEKMSDGKFCLNYYDDNGADVKRVIFNNQNKWVKTNYYNSVYGEALVCSLVPKEINGETAIMQYITGDPYPVTLYCCPIASNKEVKDKVFARVPEPEVTALTNYGLMHFATEETLKLYNQVLEEEERKYLDAHKPQVYNTEEDVANGFCFDVSSFDSTKNLDSTFDLQSADELTEDGFMGNSVVISDEADNSTLQSFDIDELEISIGDESDEYSVDKEISDAIRIITENTNLEIDESIVFAQDDIITDDVSVSVLSSENISLVEEIHSDESVVIMPIIEIVDDENSDNIAASQISFSEEETHIEPVIPTDNIDNAGLELLGMDDEAIDDYVSTLIDSILLDAKSTAQEYLLDKNEDFSDSSLDIKNDNLIKSSNYILENTPDVSIESNGQQYYYYGEVDSDNNRNGRGKTLMADGKTAYEGDYLNDMRDGVGSFFFKDGSLCYWGQWKKNNRNGFGIGISSETGVAHIGEWDNNKPVHIGVRFDKDGKFMYLDSACHKVNGGIRITGFTENSIFVEIWDEKTLKIFKKEISLEDLF